MKWYKYGALLLTAAILAACAGASDRSIVPAVNDSMTANTPLTGKAAFVIWIPVVHENDRLDPSSRRPRSMTLSIENHALQTFNLVPGSGDCPDVGGRLECSVTASLPVGVWSMTISLFDHVNASGERLSTAVTVANITRALTHLSIALDGTPASVQVFLNKATSASVYIGKSANLSVSVTAYTARNSIIMPLARYASAITLTDSDRSGATTLSATTVTKAGSPIVLHYDGAFLQRALITPSIGGTPEPSGAATLTATTSPTPSPSPTPTPAPTATPSPTPTPKPTATPTAKPTATPTPKPNPTPTPSSSPRGSPPPSASPQPGSFLGCAYPSIWTTSIANAAPVSTSSANIQATIAAGGGGGFNMWVPTHELINMANASTPLVAVTGSSPKHKPYSPIPWTSSFYIEPLSDAHSMVLQTQSCQYYEGYDTTYTNGVLSEYNGGMWDLTKPYVRPAMGSISTASGIPIGLVAIRPEELSAGYIGHALGWDAVQHTVTASACVSPAAVSDCSGDLSYSGPASEAGNAMPFGAHIRCSVNDSSFPKEAKAIAEALKTFGAYLFDTGGYNSIAATNDSYGAPTWTSADVTALGSITLSQCVVVAPPQ